MAARVSTNSTQMDLWCWIVSPNPNIRAGSEATVQFYRVADTVDAQSSSSLSFMGKTSTAEIQSDGCVAFEGPAAADFVFETRQVLIGYVTVGARGAGTSVSTPPFSLGELVSSRGCTLEYELTNGGGRLRVTATERNRNAADIYQLRFSALELPKKNVFSGTDSYLKLFRVFPTGDRKLLHKTAVISSTVEPHYAPFPVPLAQMGTANLKEDYSVLVEIWYCKTFGDDRLIGACMMTIDDLRNARRFPLLQYQENSHRLQQAAPGSPSRGVLVTTPAVIQHTKTFAEYLEEGYEINLAVSVDFTASNRPASDPLSLHRCDDQTGKLDNQYTRAILSVGPILMQYDKDKRVPVYGFGAATPITGPNNVSHFFPLTFRPDANVKDVTGIMEAYQFALPQLTFGGPTNFSPTVRNITRDAREAVNVYTILLIITDGEITDMDNTIDAIVEADDAPLSIIIVGVGNGCDFQNMDRLDCDDGFLQHRNGRVSRRDLVQFVPMRHFVNKSPQELASAVLEEVPRQFVEWSAIKSGR